MIDECFNDAHVRITVNLGVLRITDIGYIIFIINIKLKYIKMLLSQLSVYCCIPSIDIYSTITVRGCTCGPLWFFRLLGELATSNYLLSLFAHWLQEGHDDNGSGEEGDNG